MENGGAMKYLILGAGPAGLSLANRLKQTGEDNFLVLEKETSAGGLCRSVDVDGSPFDIGGGHFLDAWNPQADAFLFGFMPEEEWNKFDRDSRIAVNGHMVGHPLEANIWQMPVEDQIQYLKSIAAAGCNTGAAMPDSFVAWIYWKLGEKIAADYMIPYNRKIFGKELDELGTYWLEKLPSVSFEETLRSCLEKKAYGTLPGHAQFYYPKKYGYGEVWLRMAEAIRERIEYNKSVKNIDFAEKLVTTADGEKYRADIIVTTIPWTAFENITGMPDNIKASIKELKHSAIQTEYFQKDLDVPCHWIYYPALELPYHRILLRHNFCLGSKGYWTETNVERICGEDLNGKFKYINPYAYPLNTIRKPMVMKNLLGWCKTQGVIGLGRWGEHKHYNSDVTVSLALKLADQLRVNE